MGTLDRAIENAASKLEDYERVHHQLEDREWSEVLNDLIARGDRWQADTSYEGWRSYMTQTLINELRNIVLTKRHGK